MLRLPPLPRSSWPRAPLPPWVCRLVLVWAALALVGHVQHPAAAPVVSQAFLGFIILAIEAIASWFGAAAGAVANASILVLEWTLRGLSWIGGRLVNLVKATGGMFAKVWEHARSFWFDVMRPALQKLYGWINDVRTWLKAKLAPAFRLLSKLREHIRSLYTRFVRPILDAIEMARGVLKILEVLHVPFAQAIDRYLGELEQVLNDNFYRLLGFINAVTDTLNSIVTFDLLFQRVPFLATLRRDSPQWIAMWWNAQLDPNAHAKAATLAAQKYDLIGPENYAQELGEYYRGESNKLGAVISELVPVWFAAAGRGR